MLSTCTHAVETLISSSQTSTYGDSIYTELNMTVKEGNLEKVQLLIQQGESPNIAANYRNGVEAIGVGNLSLTINYNDDPFLVL